MDQIINSRRGSRSALLRDEQGLSTVEYVIILLLVAAVAIGSWSVFGRQVKCALGIANDTVGAGIGADTPAIGAQSCAKGTPNPSSGSSATGGGTPSTGTTTPEEHVKKKHPNEPLDIR